MDEGLTTFDSNEDAGVSPERPMTAQQAREYVGALLTNPHVKVLILDFAFCRPEALEAFVPYIRSSNALSALALRVDRLVTLAENTEATAPFQGAVNSIYCAAAENSNLVEISTDVIAAPRAVVKLLTSSTLKKLYLGVWSDHRPPATNDRQRAQALFAARFSRQANYRPTVTHYQQLALSAGFYRNKSLEKVYLAICDGATPSALRTIISGLCRHPRLEELFIETCKNDSELPGGIAKLIGSAVPLRVFRFHGKRNHHGEEDDAPLEIDPLFDVPGETTMESLSFCNKDIVGGRSTNEDTMLSVSKVEFNGCAFESSESLLMLSRLSRLENLKISGCTGLHSNVAGQEQSETRGPGPIEQLVEQHKCLAEIVFKTSLNDHNIMDISQSLSHFDSLASLTLDSTPYYSPIGTEAMNLLLSSLHRNKGLRKLRLGSNWDQVEPSISGGALRAMLRTNKALTHLDLRCARIDGETFQGLCDGLLDNATLKILELPRVPPGGLSALGGAIGSGSNALEEMRVTIYASPTPDTNDVRAFFRSLSRASGLKKLSLWTADDTSVYHHFRTDDSEAASLLLKAAEMNPSLCELDTSLDGEFVAVEEKLRFQLEVNRFRRQLANYPKCLWPRVLAQMDGPYGSDVRYYFLRPEIDEWGQDQRLLCSDAKKRVSHSDDNESSSRKKHPRKARRK